MSRKTFRLAWLLAALIIFGSGSAVLSADIRTFSNNTVLLIPDESGGVPGTTFSNIVFGGGSCLIDDVNVTVDISHTFNADLILSLEGTSTQVCLSENNGGPGDGFDNTTFDDEATTAIQDAVVFNPFSGSFRPEEPLSSFDGKDALGTWTLTVIDTEDLNTGSLNSWSITIQCADVGGVGGATHYLTYKIKADPKFDKMEVVLTDAFQSGTFKIEKRETLLTPVDTDDGGIADSETHLLGYKIKGPQFDKVPDVLVENQFGQLLVDVEHPEDLLVPASKSLLDSGISAPINASHQVNHFLCYKVKLSHGEPKFEPILGVRLVDQFEDKLYDLVKPERLCTPVDDGEGIKNSVHLLCYRAEHAKFFVNDQFGPGQVDTRTKRELCVPTQRLS